MNLRTRTLAAVAAGVALTAGAGDALAQHADDKYWVHLGGYLPTIRSTARSDFLAVPGSGTVVNFEQDLGLTDRKAMPLVQLGSRLGQRWRVEFEYFSVSRDASSTITRDLTWGDTVYPASATVGGSFDSAIYRLSAGYSFWQTGQSEAGVVAGLHVTDFKLALNTQVTAGSVSGSGQSQAEDALVPLPTIGLYGKYGISREWSLMGRFDLFSFNSGPYQGALVNAMLGVTYRINDRIGVSGGYRYLDYSLDVDKSNWRGSVDYRFSGPYLMVQLGI